MKPFLHEKISFYLFWICKFLLAIPGLRVTREYINLAVCLAQGKKLALAPLVLGTLYKGMFTFVDKKVSDACGGPLWIFQAWLYAYFPQIRLTSWYSLREDCQRKELYSYAEYFYNFLANRDETSFDRYFRFFYDIKKENHPIFNPFYKFEYSSEKLRKYFDRLCPSSSTNTIEGSEEKRLFWASILVPKLIPTGFAMNNTPFGNCSFESYSLCQLARQFGFVQPVPFVHQQIVEMATKRYLLKLRDAHTITMMIIDYKNRVKDFKLPEFKAGAGTTDSFNEWWTIMGVIFFNSPIQECLYRLDPEFKSLQDKAGNYFP